MPPSSFLKMVALYLSEALVFTGKSKLCHDQKTNRLYLHHRETFGSHTDLGSQRKQGSGKYVYLELRK
jgi:hypothetical protein